MEKRKVGRGRLVRSVRKRRRKVVSLIAKIIVMNSSVFQYRIKIGRASCRERVSSPV